MQLHRLPFSQKDWESLRNIRDALRVSYFRLCSSLSYTSQEPSHVQQTFLSVHAPTVWCVVAGFEFLIECWETMSTNSQYVGLKDTLENGIKSLHKWHGHTDGTAPAYFICLGKFLLSSLILLCWANLSPKVLDPNVKDMTQMSRTCIFGMNGTISSTLLA
jgi:hypothetical protein